MASPAKEDPIKGLIHWMDEKRVWEVAGRIPEVWERLSHTYASENQLEELMKTSKLPQVDLLVSSGNKEEFEKSLRKSTNKLFRPRMIKMIQEAASDLIAYAPDQEHPELPIRVAYRREEGEAVKGSDDKIGIKIFSIRGERAKKGKKS